MHVLDMEPRAENRVSVLRKAMHVLRYGAESRKPSQCIRISKACIKIGVHVLRYAIAFGKAIVRLIVKRYGMTLFLHCATIFDTVRTFGENFFELFPGAPFG